MLPDGLAMRVLRVHSMAQHVSNDALALYYTGTAFHLKDLERDLDTLEQRVAGLRAALEAPRSRGEDPLKNPGQADDA